MRNGIPLLIVILLATGIPSSAQPGSTALIWGSDGADSGKRIVVDQNNNVYVLGYFSLEADFDPGPGENFISAADYIDDIYLSKFDESLRYQWTITFKPPCSTIPFDMVIDSQGNIYIAWQHLCTVDISAGHRMEYDSPFSSSETYITRLDGSGNFLWATRLDAIIFDLDTDNTGNLYFAGWTRWHYFEEIESGESASVNRSILGKINSDGETAWTRIVNDAHDSVGSCVAADSDSAVYVLGEMDDNAYLARYSADGSLEWENYTYGPGWVNFLDMDMAVDRNGNAVCSVRFFEYAPAFGPDAANAHGNGAFVASYDRQGNLLWHIDFIANRCWISTLSASGDYVFIGGSLPWGLEGTKNGVMVLNQSAGSPDAFMDVIPDGNIRAVWVDDLALNDNQILVTGWFTYEEEVRDEKLAGMNSYLVALDWPDI